MANHRGGILVFIGAYLHFIQSSPLSVPLITWSNSDTTKLQVPSITAGKTRDLSDTYKIHIEPLIKTHPLSLVFLQDELSADDLTKYASSFPHLQKILQTKEYLLLPSVSKEKENINELISGSVSDIEYVDSGSLNEWKYKQPSDSNGKKVVVFHLEPLRGVTTDGKDDILKSNDLAMHKIVKSLKEKVNDFGVIYTAEDPSQMIANILLEENIDDSGLASRHLLATNANKTPKLFNNTCVMVYADSIKHTYGNETTEFIVPDGEGIEPWKVGGCGSTNSGCSISLTRPGTFGNYYNATLLIEFKNSTVNWYCRILRFSGQYNGTDFADTWDTCGGMEASGIDSPVYNEINAPIGMSFACHKLTFSKNTSRTVTLGGIQLQTACDGSGAIQRFASAYHCVGFFTIEIWTAIFVTVILMIGLYVGIMMMMAIQVQDRFDDPKGKTISMAPSSE